MKRPGQKANNAPKGRGDHTGPNNAVLVLVCGYGFTWLIRVAQRVQKTGRLPPAHDDDSMHLIGQIACVVDPLSSQIA